MYITPDKENKIGYDLSTSIYLQKDSLVVHSFNPMIVVCSKQPFMNSCFRYIILIFILKLNTNIFK